MGGSNNTPFSTPFELSEIEISTTLKELASNCDKDARTMIFSHFPPFNCKCDDIGDDTHVGSHSLTDFIVRNQPNLVLCSHIHEGGGKKDKIGDTTILNIGRLSQGHAYLLDTNDKELIKRYP